MDNRFKKYIPFFYFIFLAFILFVNNGRVSLWDQDEAAYAGFAREMIRSGNWLIPDFMWSEIHRKPPLHFWDICLSYKLFGINEFAVRFPSALFLFFTYLLLYFAGRPLFGKRIAFMGVVVLSTSLFVPSLAKVSVTDATLLFFSGVCAFALVYIMQERSIKWTVAFWISFALALLTKGPPIILFTGVFAVLLFILHPNRKNLFSMHPWFFLPLACLPLFLWGYFVSKQDGGVFISWMIDWYILKRVNSSVLGQTGPPGTHLLSLFVFFIPYFMFLPKAFWDAVSSVFKKEKGTAFLLSAWFISGWFIYEWSPSKLPTYVIAAHLPLALFIAREIVHSMESSQLPSRFLIVTHFSLILLIFAALIAGPFIIKMPSYVGTPFILAGSILIIFTLIIIYRRRRSGLPRYLISVNILFQFLAWGILLPAADQLKNGSKKVARYADQYASPKSVILIANEQGHPPSLPFYLGYGFKKIRTEEHLDTLLSVFKSNTPCVLILNKEQRDSTLAKVPGTSFREIRSMLTDRDQDAHYYIAINKSGQKEKEIADK